MTILNEKLQNIRNQLFLLLSQLKKMCITKISLIPTQIEKVSVGTNKLPLYFSNSTPYEINENDLIGATEIRSSMFSHRTMLTSVTISDSVIEIGSQAFYNCTGLTSVTISDSVTSIGWFAFSECPSLANIYIHSTTPPTLSSGLNLIPSHTTIHVPIGSGDTYRNATNWSYSADKIVEDITLS